MLTMTSFNVIANSFSESDSGLINPDSKSDLAVCKFATILPVWRTEVLRRGITCDDDGNLLSPSVKAPTAPAEGQIEEIQTEVATPDPVPAPIPSPAPQTAVPASGSSPSLASGSASNEEEINPVAKLAGRLDDLSLCRMATNKQGEWRTTRAFSVFVDEAIKRGLGCGLKGDTPTATASLGNDTPSTPVIVDDSITVSGMERSSFCVAGTRDKDTNAQLVQTPVAETDKSAPNQLTNAVPEIMILAYHPTDRREKSLGRSRMMRGLPNCVSTVDRLFLRAMADLWLRPMFRKVASLYLLKW